MFPALTFFHKDKHLLLRKWCVCTFHALTHLDDILGIHSLDKIRETVEESISCSSLERQKREGVRERLL